MGDLQKGSQLSSLGFKFSNGFSGRNAQRPATRFDFPTSFMADPIAEEHKRHLAFVDTNPAPDHLVNQAGPGELETAPLLTTAVNLSQSKALPKLGLDGNASRFPQYGLLGYRQGTFTDGGYKSGTDKTEDNMVYGNGNAPWSAFICGSQGSGKSHTLSCLLENSLVSPSPVGQLPRPLAGIVFHYDKFTSMATTQLCEAAYLCSAGVPVRVLVSPSNLHTMRRLYSDLPGLRADAKRPQVIPMYFQERHLNNSNILTLMSVNNSTGSKPLYLEVLCKILREMATERPDRPGIDYLEFKRRLGYASFSRDQKSPLELRLQLLESFLDLEKKAGRHGHSQSKTWQFEPGSLTIVDLSDPFVNGDDACTLFSICLSLFMEHRGQTGRVIALDEAHKFLTQSGEALDFTEKLQSIIRQQRHLATRVLVATQEPTLSPSLIDLCDVTIVHRFRSPAWFETLKKHLSGAGLASGGGGASSSSPNESTSLKRSNDIFRTIVSLQTGEAVLFSPAAVLDLGNNVSEYGDATNPFATRPPPPPPQKLNDSYIRIRIRTRTTADGGKSIMAIDPTRRSAP